MMSATESIATEFYYISHFNQPLITAMNSIFNMLHGSNLPRLLFAESPLTFRNSQFTDILPISCLADSKDL